MAPPPESDRLGRVERAAVVDGELIIVVKFDSDEAMRKAMAITENLDRMLFSVHDDHVMLGLATEDFYDGP